MTDLYESLTKSLFDDLATKMVDPTTIFKAWLAEAEKSETNNANAMSVATADENGRPDVRTILLKGCDDTGFVFYTNLQSAKGHQLAVNPAAAMLFHWKSLGRQVRIRGDVVAVSATDADAYFASRPRQSQIGAHASNQSRPLADRSTLVDSSEKLTNEFEGKQVPRPDHWSGYCLVPSEIEFWMDGEFRLHDRMLFTRANADDPWQRQRLAP